MFVCISFIFKADPGLKSVARIFLAGQKPLKIAIINIIAYSLFIFNT